ncbi:GTP pyrophosphokinase ywaC [Oligella urethralis]|uniref:GTP pyrophosphokinase n=1 Tax=Oligella urethralis TaxID=90245 RepID=UPI000DFAAB47|nr:hypothetical protein [Oligella urethralis]SUA56934.1 GTP pyrophosphokinase ywaC [Oligella urethralis]
MTSFTSNSKKGINRAGEYLAGRSRNKISSNLENDKKALEVLNDWRKSHVEPLDLIQKQINKVLAECRIKDSSLLSTRLKRAESIINKLKRFDGMTLTRMQDVAGARVILSNIEEVRAFVTLFCSEGDPNNNNNTYEVIKSDNYIEKPKSDGYRSIHMVCKVPFINANNISNEFSVEVQVRTKLQHAWATAVEVMGLYERSQLKSGQGNKSILTIFELCSALLSLEEKLPLSPQYEEWSKEQMSHRLKALDEETKFFFRLENFNLSLKHVTNDLAKELRDKEIICYLLILNLNEKKLRIRPFVKDDEHDPTETYRKYEKQILKGAPLDVVLVTVSDRTTLEDAYPNYFADTKRFCEIIKKIVFYELLEYNLAVSKN